MAFGPAFSSGVVRADPGFALTGDNRLLQFDTNSPGSVGPGTPISGLDAGEDLIGVDFRPSAPGQLYGLSNFGQLYTINTSSGAAAPVGAALPPEQLPLQGRSYGFAFNPVPDAIRLVSDIGENYRINPNTGALIAKDGDLTYAAGDPSAGVPSDVTAAAYTNNDTDPATGTTLYVIDSAAGNLVIQNPPNDGTLTTVGSLGLGGPEAGLLIRGFDIAGAGNRAFALTTGLPDDLGTSSPSRLFGINLQTGAATPLGVLGDGSADVVSLAIVPEPSAALAGALATAVAAAWRPARRRRNRAV